MEYPHVTKQEIDTVFAVEMRRKNDLMIRIAKEIKKLENQIKKAHYDIIVAKLTELQESMEVQAALTHLFKIGKAPLSKIDSKFDECEVNQYSKVVVLLSFFKPRIMFGMWFDSNLKKPVIRELRKLKNLIRDSKGETTNQLVLYQRTTGLAKT